MANNYTHVAFEFDAGTSENAQKVHNLLSSRDLYLEVAQDDHILILTSESAEVERLAEALRGAMQTLPEIPSPQGFEWAVSADKHRVGDFGGGAIVIRRERPLKSIDTASWLNEELTRSEGSG